MRIRPNQSLPIFSGLIIRVCYSKGLKNVLCLRPC